jgi:hypothetical protein
VIAGTGGRPGFPVQDYQEESTFSVGVLARVHLSGWQDGADRNRRGCDRPKHRWPVPDPAVEAMEEPIGIIGMLEAML